MPCSKCKGIGHNARSCSQFLSTPESQDSTSYDNLNENVVDSINKHNSYYCYFLGQHDNWNGQTYNGYTTNLQRRLRQHNGEIKGGAWATTAKDNGAWSFIAVLTSSSWNSISRAMACEWNCRYPTRKKPRPKIYAGSQGRINSLIEIFKHIKDDIHLYIHPVFYQQALTLNLPPHVTIHESLENIISK